MDKEPDFAALARQYLDLWEDQLTAMAADPDLAEQSARFFEAMTQLGKDVNPALTANLAEFLKTAQPGARHDSTAAEPAAHGTEAAAAASGNRDERVDQLTRRIAALEKRLDGLEPGGGRPRKSSSGSTRTKRSGAKSGAKKRGSAKSEDK